MADQEMLEKINAILDIYAQIAQQQPEGDVDILEADDEDEMVWVHW